VTTRATGHRRLTGHLRVPCPPQQAYVLFTPRGEQRWAKGWEPRFAAPTGDDTTPGTVFETHAHGMAATWIVIDRVPGRSIRYARVVPGHHAGTVAVSLYGRDGRTEVSVTYELTALSQAGARQLAAFAADYPAFLQSWQEAIERSLGGQSH
jgi:hypothetical protein